MGTTFAVGQLWVATQTRPYGIEVEIGDLVRITGVDDDDLIKCRTLKMSTHLVEYYFPRDPTGAFMLVHETPENIFGF
jgi:hypothetical protein